jgi:hypothetical protein
VHVTEQLGAGVKLACVQGSVAHCRNGGSSLRLQLIDDVRHSGQLRSWDQGR